MNRIIANEIATINTYLPETKATPKISEFAAIRNSQIIGNVTINDQVHVVNAVIRADEGSPFYIDEGSNIQDFAILHGYANRENDIGIENSLVFIKGKGFYSIYISKYVSISHGVLIHGPAFIAEKTFIGFKATIDGSTIGKNAEIGAHAYIKNTVIPDNIAIAANAVIMNEKDIEKFTIEPIGINDRIVKINIEMAKTYSNK